MNSHQFAKVAMLRDIVNSAAMEPKVKDIYYLLTIVCGKYLTIKAGINYSVKDLISFCSVPFSFYLHALFTKYNILQFL